MGDEVFADPKVGEAFKRLVAYAEYYHPGDLVHGPSGLTADDLDLLIKQLLEMREVVSIPYIDLRDLNHRE